VSADGFGYRDGGNYRTSFYAEVRALSLLPLRASATSRRRPMPRWLARRSEPGWVPLVGAL